MSSLLRRLQRRVEDRLYKNKTYDYLSDATPQPPVCPHCFTPLDRLTEHVIYSFHFRNNRFRIDKDCLRAILCPFCNHIIDSAALRALIDYDSSLTSERRGGENKT